MRLNHHNAARLHQVRKHWFEGISNRHLRDMAERAALDNRPELVSAVAAELELRVIDRQYEFDISKWSDEQLCQALLLAFGRDDKERVAQLAAERQRRQADE